jgi:hypothetical protein
VVHCSLLTAAALAGRRSLGRGVVGMIPVGIVLLLLEVVIELIVEIVEAGFLIGGWLGTRQILLVAEIFLVIFGVIGALDVARSAQNSR